MKKVIGFLAFILLPAGLMAQASYDILLKGGHVIDPKNDISRTMDVAVKDGKIAAVEADIPESAAEKVVDVKGLYVTPGLIDIHDLNGLAGTPWEKYYSDPEKRN